MANPPEKPFTPPVPRDHADASFSEMVPLRSSKINLFKSPLFLLALLAAIMAPFMFSVLDGIYGPNRTIAERVASFTLMAQCAVFFIVVLIQIMIYLYVRPKRTIWIYFIPFIAVAAQLYIQPILQIWFFFFRTLLPGDAQPLMQALISGQGEQPTFVQMFVAMWFGAGMMEELMKASPILFGAWLAMRAIRNPAAASGQLYRLMHVRGPLDGALMGIFAGGAFVFIETGFMYVPNMLRMTNDLGTGIGMGFGLLLPRVFNGLVGHMAYAGIFGYFIGLAVIRPKARWKLLAIGYFVATLLHTLWNSVMLINPMLQYAVAIATALWLGAVVLKARQMEMASGLAGAETSGSIVVERPGAGAMPMAPAMAPQPQAPHMPPQPAAHVPPPPQTAPPAPQTAPPAAAAPAEALAINIDGMMMPLRAGGKLDLAAEPALGGRGAGIVGAIIPHPTRANVLGLRNEGTAGWRAKLRDGSEQMIDHDQSIRLAVGVEIQFADGLRGAVVKLG